MPNVEGLYYLCIKYENDTTPYMVGFVKNGDSTLYRRLNLELIDEFTSAYPSKQALLDRIGQSVSSKRKPIDVFILYHQAQKGNVYDTEYETIPTVRKLDVIVNDPNIHSICKKFINDKYIEANDKKLDKDDEIITYVFNKIIHMVETEKGFNEINNDPFLSQYLAKFKEKLLAHGTYSLNASNQESSNTYPVAKEYFLKSYTSFRHAYIHFMRKDLKDASIYSTGDPIRKKRKDVQITETVTKVKPEIVDEVCRIQDSFLRSKYIEADEDAENVFLYLGEDFCDELSDNDKKIVFGDYDLFKERMKNEYPDIFRSRGI